MARRSWLRGLGIGCGGILVLGAGALYLTEPGKAFRDIWGSGAIQQAMTPTEKIKYSSTSAENLKAIYTALRLYHDSEGQFPVAAGWMDAIQNRLATNELPMEEAKKKLIQPTFLPPRDGVFGYAMNDAASGKYKDDLKDPKTILIFDSSDTTRNAHGDPAKLAPKPERPGGNLGLTVSGDVVKLP